jgi:hypothetical protein
VDQLTRLKFGSRLQSLRSGKSELSPRQQDGPEAEEGSHFEFTDNELTQKYPSTT